MHAIWLTFLDGLAVIFLNSMFKRMAKPNNKTVGKKTDDILPGDIEARKFAVTRYLSKLGSLAVPLKLSEFL